MGLIAVFAMVAIAVLVVSGFRRANRFNRQFDRVFDSALDQIERGAPPPEQSSSADYQCDNCGATIADLSEVSPHGDARCPYCQNWFNVRS